MKPRIVWTGAASVGLALALACGSPTSSSQGNVRVMLKDSPYSDARAVLVTFSEVSVHASGGGWTSLTFTGGASSRTCDLKQLTSAQDILGTGSLPAGHYTEIRLVVSSAALYFDKAAATGPCASSIAPPSANGAAMQIPPDQLILNGPFDVRDGNTATILLDFDGDRSISQTGNGAYKMQPVINVVSVQ